MTALPNTQNPWQAAVDRRLGQTEDPLAAAVSKRLSQQQRNVEPVAEAPDPGTRRINVPLFPEVVSRGLQRMHTFADIAEAAGRSFTAVE
ncbi:MAG: hypothetical protein ACYSUI_25970, partial [Planctomycetota bacterium]